MISSDGRSDHVLTAADLRLTPSRGSWRESTIFFLPHCQRTPSLINRGLRTGVGHAGLTLLSSQGAAAQGRRSACCQNAHAKYVPKRHIALLFAQFRTVPATVCKPLPLPAKARILTLLPVHPGQATRPAVYIEGSFIQFLNCAVVMIKLCHAAAPDANPKFASNISYMRRQRPARPPPGRE
jgi:hypothetical protein